MKVYSFKFELLDRVTATTRRITKSFDVAKRVTMGFENGLHNLGLKEREAAKRMGYLRYQTVLLNRSFQNMPGVMARSFGAGIRNMGERLRQLPGQVSGSLGRMARNASLVIGVGTTAFLKSTVDTLAKFEGYEAVLTNAFLGDADAARRVMGDIRDFAAKTPFQVDELTESFVKMNGRGIAATQAQMANMGDLAASLGKDFGQLTEAILDVNNTERWNEIGIKVKTVGDRITATYKGVTVSGEKTERGALALVEQLAKLAPGVKGTMEAISKTTGGMLSNLADQWTNLKYSVGLAIAPILSELIPKLIKLLGRVSKWFEANKSKIVATLSAMWSWFERNGQTIWNTIVFVGKLVAAFYLISGVIKVVQALIFVWRGLRVAMLFVTGPIGLIIAGIVAIGVAVWAVVRYWDEIKTFLLDVAKVLWENHPLRWMVDMIERVFPGFKKALGSVFAAVKQWALEAWNWLRDKFVKPLTEAFNSIFGVFGKKVEQGAFFEVAAESGSGSGSKESDADFYDGLNNLYGGKKPVGMGASGFSATKTGDTGISGGGSIKHITISIESLVEQITIQTNNITDLKNKAKEAVTEALLSAVNDENYAN